MNKVIEERWYSAQQEYLNELANMLARNDEYAEKNGGVDNLPEPAQKAYHARRNALIRLTQFNDSTQEYIDELHNWISSLITDRQRIMEEMADNKQEWRKFFPRMTKMGETEREHFRKMHEIQVRLKWENWEFCKYSEEEIELFRKEEEKRIAKLKQQVIEQKSLPLENTIQ